MQRSVVIIKHVAYIFYGRLRNDCLLNTKYLVFKALVIVEQGEESDDFKQKIKNIEKYKFARNLTVGSDKGVPVFQAYLWFEPV